MDKDEKLPRGPENLDDTQLEDVAGGATVVERMLFLCPTCGKELDNGMTMDYGPKYLCKSCNKRVWSSDAVRRYVTVTIDGDFHTVSGEF